jgi:hypothetical protein
MKAEKGKFDKLFGTILKTKAEPRKKMMTQGRKGSKTLILAK